MSRELVDSNIEWLGKIPSNWNLQPLKRVVRERNELNKNEEESFLLSLTIQDGVIPYSEKTGGGNKAKEDISKYKIVKKNDIVINSMNVVVGAAGISKYNGLVSPVYYIFSETNKSCARFYNYMFLNQTFENHLFGLGNGILVKINEDNGKMNTIRKKIPIEKLNNEYIPVPSKDEQIKIANYLDKKVSLIDETIANNKKEIELLEEYQKSKIEDIVTGKLIKKSKKNINSGWLNEIPSDWKFISTKNYFDFGKGLSITKENLSEKGVPVISYGQIHSKLNKITRIVDDVIRFVPETYLEENKNCLVHKNDFIFADTSEDLDGSGNNIYIDREEKMFAGYHSIILSPKNRTNTKYFAYLFMTEAWRSQVRATVTGVKLFSISQKILKNTTILVPPEEEQEKICKELDFLSNNIETIKAYRQQIIEKLEEYKKALIYEVVTGKIEV